MGYHCFKCGTDVAVGANNQVGFKESCDKCLSDLHCCRNCSFYDNTAYNNCRESSAERVVEKEKANYCDYFRFGDGKGGKNSAADDARKKLDDIFK